MPEPEKKTAPLPEKKSLLRRALTPIARPLIRKLRKEIVSQPPLPKPLWPEVPLSDGFWESLGCNVIHFPYQNHAVCALPTVYNPHDLQHLHFPQYFSPGEIARRETIYPAGCHFANTIVVASEWIKQDIVKQYAVHPKKIQVVPWAPPTQAYETPNEQEIDVVREKYCLDTPFAFFPAMTWEHKNHIRLIEAYQEARRETDVDFQIVCTGKQHDPHWSRIKEILEKEGLAENVRFVGLVPEKDLRCIYKLALFVIVPTLFEAASGPVFEAWHEGTPVACSTVTSLPEQVADAAQLFNPLSVNAIKKTLVRMTNEPALREELISKGQRRLQDFSWEQTAKAYRAVYRRAAGSNLTEEDIQLLGWDWMRHSSERTT
jgi:glycosyltransferase involved in cell wall biosynthesis